VDTLHAPTLVFIVGPPAVGKMTVGYELARRTGLKLFHNHHTIELVLQFFPFGTPPFGRLVHEFRRRIFEEVAGSPLPGLIFTYVWAFDQPSETAAVENLAGIFAARGGRVVYAELEATLDERLVRNESEFRLAQKPSKRDVAVSRQRLLQHDAQYQLNSAGRFDGREDWLRIDNTHLPPADAAEQIIRHFSIPLAPAADAGG
jgi:hypothetical protein